MVTHLIDREHTTAHHLCFRVGEGREDEPWTIAEADFLPQIESLEMLGKWICMLAKYVICDS